MSVEKIDAIVGEATTAPEIQTENQEPKVEKSEEADPEKQAEASIDKKFENLKTKLKREIRQTRAQASQREQQLMAEINDLKSRTAPKEGPPDENDPKFQSYADVIEAKMEWKIKQALEQNQQQQTQHVSATQEQQWVKQRESEVNNQTEEFLEANPQYAEVLEENAEIIQYFTPEIGRAFLQADNAPLAFVTLAEEGKLESLLRMTPAKAAMEIAKAEIRGEAMLKSRQTTQAPAPISASRGSGSAGVTNIARLDAKDLLKHINNMKG